MHIVSTMDLRSGHIGTSLTCDSFSSKLNFIKVTTKSRVEICQGFKNLMRSASVSSGGCADCVIDRFLLLFIKTIVVVVVGDGSTSQINRFGRPNPVFKTGEKGVCR